MKVDDIKPFIDVNEETSYVILMVQEVIALTETYYKLRSKDSQVESESDGRPQDLALWYRRLFRDISLAYLNENNHSLDLNLKSLAVGQAKSDE